MGTKSTTSTTNQYNTQSNNAYNALAPAGANQLGSEISSPYNNNVINGQRAIAAPANYAANIGTRATLSNNLGALGTSGGTGYSNYAGNTVGRFGSATVAQTGNSLLMGAASNRNQALGSAMGFRPLQTGGTSTQQITGTGTWLPTVLGAGVAGAQAFAQSQQAPAVGGNMSPQMWANGFADANSQGPTGGGAGSQNFQTPVADPVWGGMPQAPPPTNYGF